VEPDLELDIGRNPELELELDIDPGLKLDLRLILDLNFELELIPAESELDTRSVLREGRLGRCQNETADLILLLGPVAAVVVVLLHLPLRRSSDQ